MTTKCNSKESAITNVLQKLYRKYNRRNLIKPDPLQFVYNYSSRADMEISGLLSAVLAYGRVEQIQNSLTKLFRLMGDSPYEFVRDFNKARSRKLHGFRHRFTTGDDISDMLMLLKKVFKKYDNIENYFLLGYSKTDHNIIPALTYFSDSLLKMHTTEHAGETNRGLKYLLVSPAEGSACKRLNLFLRWMVRDDRVDAGLWKHVDKAKLVVPVDVHMGRLCRILGFHNNKTVSLKTAIKITEMFARIEPSDPVKYDFALSRVGIIENCTGKYKIDCELCELSSFCLQR